MRALPETFDVLMATRTLYTVCDHGIANKEASILFVLVSLLLTVLSCENRRPFTRTFYNTTTEGGVTRTTQYCGTCEAGTYYDPLPTPSCKQCPANRTSTAQSATSGICYCQPGYFGDSLNSDQFRPTANVRPCLRCQGDTISAGFLPWCDSCSDPRKPYANWLKTACGEPSVAQPQPQLRLSLS
jgi:hypothetical protein